MCTGYLFVMYNTMNIQIEAGNFVDMSTYEKLQMDIIQCFLMVHTQFNMKLSLMDIL